MSEYYDKIYTRRLNRYGLNYQSRIQNQRERDFDNYLYKTIYRVDFEYNNDYHPGSLERYKQDYSETQCYLLTKKETVIPNGTVLMIESQNGSKKPWMVWWLEQIEASGYNRYVVLRMTYKLEWENEQGKFSQWAYFLGPGASMINDTVRSSTTGAVYKENNNNHMFITAQNSLIVKDQYFEVEQDGTRLGYVISGYDIISTAGVGYITVDPVALREKKTIPEKDSTDTSDDFYWINGGKS